MFDPIVSVNGLLGGGVSPLDRGFNYGDGLFETVRLAAVGNELKLPLWNFHRERLLSDCERLQIPLVVGELDGAVNQILCEAQKKVVDSAVVKIIVTRGVGGRGYLPADNAAPTICVGLHPPPVYPAKNSLEGVNLHLCSQVLSANPLLAGAKHLNKLEYILARSEWSDQAISEGLLLDSAGDVVEGTFSNVFMVRNGDLLTPLLEDCGVSGVMRRLITDVLAPRLGVVVKRERISLQSLIAADEVFVCNSVLGIWPVLSLGRDCWARGQLTQCLQAELASYLLEVSDD